VTSSTIETKAEAGEPGPSAWGKVRLLSDGLINKIAAGEVIERPASVVKELMENSLDAGASRIQVTVEQGGRGLIAIQDDGEGMERQDALMALERHATSKLRSDEDLFRIDSLGFRGEALPSIAEVSRFDLTTGTRGATAGTRLVLDGGVWGEIEDAANPGGTEIRVRRLFFNTPVRLKFLKTPRTEMHHVLDVVQRMALSHPGVAVKLISDGRSLLDAPKNQTLAERVRLVLGKAVSEGMRSLVARDGALRLEGLISAPHLHRSSRASLFLFVNGRFVRDRSVVGALLSAYREVLPKGRYPIAVLFLDLPPAEVDVNVHPAKVEVRFQDSPEIWRFVGGAVAGVLARTSSGDLQQGPLFAAPVEEEKAAKPRGASVSASDEPSVFRDPARDRAERVIAKAKREQEAGGQQAPLLDPFGFASSPTLPELGAPSARSWAERLASQDAAQKAWGEKGRPMFAYGTSQGWFGRWILWALEDELLLVDPRAAHRRLVFSNLRQSEATKALESRRLLVPALFEVDVQRIDVLVGLEAELGERGIELSDFGRGSLALHAGPSGLHPSRLSAAIERLLEQDESCGGLSEADFFYELDALLAWFSGPASLEGVSEDTLISIVAQLDTVSLAFACPFGLRTCARISLEDAEAWFRLKR
jgi:DNA mismatch repair protein MutL